jgi:hypothetical protein
MPQFESSMKFDRYSDDDSACLCNVESIKDDPPWSPIHLHSANHLFWALRSDIHQS